MMNCCMNKCQINNLCRYNYYRNYYAYPMYPLLPAMYPFIYFVNTPVPTGTLNTICNSTENVIYDTWFPNPLTVSIFNRSTDCVAICYIYYSDGFYEKRLSGQAQPGQTYTFNEVKSVLKISIQCNPMRKNCTSCSNGAEELKCIVDYYLS